MRLYGIGSMSVYHVDEAYCSMLLVWVVHGVRRLHCLGIKFARVTLSRSEVVDLWGEMQVV